MNFTRWLKQYRKADTARGDLARDVARDREWPNRRQGTDDLDTYRLYLSHCGASGNAIATLEKAWRDYQLYLNR